jgi:hypothetical protein
MIGKNVENNKIIIEAQRMYSSKERTVEIYKNIYGGTQRKV